MSPQRAFHYGVRADEVTVTSRAGYRKGEWVIYNRDGQPVTQFASVYNALFWIKQLGAMEK